MGIKYNRFLFFISSLLIAVIAFQNCSDVTLKSKPLQPSNLNPSAASEASKACPSAVASSGIWNTNSPECMENPMQEVTAAIDYANSLNPPRWPLEVSKNYLGDGYQIRSVAKGLSPDKPYYTKQEMDFFKSQNMTYFKECSYLGVINAASSGAGSNNAFFPIIYNEGSVYFAFKTGSINETYTISTELGQATFSNFMGGSMSEGGAGVGGDGPWFITLTESPCDFDYDYLDNPNRVQSKTACGSSGHSASTGFTFSVGQNQNCSLQMNKIYYLNIRREFAADIPSRGKSQYQPGGPLFSSPQINFKKLY